jgi:flavin reductase (DIM6/NTAB) family NADH-FMN oxidoreductase RutF/DNA-binding MarR family transcriptional regulator
MCHLALPRKAMPVRSIESAFGASRSRDHWQPRDEKVTDDKRRRGDLMAMGKSLQAFANAPAVDEGDPTIDPRAFRRCLGQFSTGVTVVTSATGGSRAGVTANSFSSLSIDPPLVLWSISRTSRSFAQFAKADHFTINVLATGQIEVSQRFAGMAEDKFEGIEFETGANGSPILPGVSGYLECRCEARYPGGDHLILVGRVERFARFSGHPLVFSQGRYAVAGTHPALARVTADATPSSFGNDSNRLSGLIFQAHRASWLAFDIYRNEEALTFPQGMILFAIWREPLAIAAIADRVLLPANLVADECKEFSERALIVTDQQGRIALTEAGRQLHERIRQRAMEFEAGQLRDFTAEQVDAARDFLRAYAEGIFASARGERSPRA